MSNSNSILMKKRMALSSTLAPRVCACARLQRPIHVKSFKRSCFLERGDQSASPSSWPTFSPVWASPCFSTVTSRKMLPSKPQLLQKYIGCEMKPVKDSTVTLAHPHFGHTLSATLFLFRDVIVSLRFLMLKDKTYSTSMFSWGNPLSTRISAVLSR